MRIRAGMGLSCPADPGYPGNPLPSVGPMPIPQTSPAWLDAISNDIAANVDSLLVGDNSQISQPSMWQGVQAWISQNSTPLLVASGAFFVLALFGGRR